MNSVISATRKVPQRLRVIVVAAILVGAGLYGGRTDAQARTACAFGMQVEQISRTAIGRGSGASWNLAHQAGWNGAEAGIVFIVNGNDHGTQIYQPLAEHLATQGYAVRIIERPSAGTDVSFVHDEVEQTLQHLGLDQTAPVGLVGHSVGGGSVSEIARLFGGGMNIRAVVALAPSVQMAPLAFDGRHARGLLTIYGSQDEDLGGHVGPPAEAFAAYDRTGTESTTTSPLQRHTLLTNAAIDKAMVYVYGADHSGFVDYEGRHAESRERDYLSVPTQSCIARTYVSAFLAWKMAGEAAFRSYFVGNYLPPDVAALTTSEPDYAGSPSELPVRIAQQFAARKRVVLANFETATAHGAGPDVSASIVYPHAIDSKARHSTRALLLAWRHRPWARKWELTVPASARNLSQLDSLSLRVGQISDGQAHHANAGDAADHLFLDLVDGDGASQVIWLGDSASVPSPDLRPEGSAGHRHMSTISIPLSRWGSIDRTNVRQLRLWVRPNTRGAVMVDSIEASYDD